MGQAPARTAVWYAVAVNDIDRWTLRVSMTLDADGGPREDLHPEASRPPATSCARGTHRSRGPSHEHAARCRTTSSWSSAVTGSSPPEAPLLNDADLLRRRIDAGASDADLGPRLLGPAGERASRALLPIEWPSGLEPTPVPLAVEPATDDPLPRADVLVVTWTAAEWRALADVLTPGVDGPRRWYRYDRELRVVPADDPRRGTGPDRPDGSVRTTSPASARARCCASSPSCTSTRTAFAPATAPPRFRWPTWCASSSPRCSRSS